MLHYHSEENAYFGTTSEGRTIRVEGDEYAESLQHGRAEEAKRLGYDPDNLTEEQREECENVAIDAACLDDPDVWASLAGENQNVTFATERP